MSSKRRRAFYRMLMIQPRWQLSVLAWIWIVVVIGMVLAALISAIWFAYASDPSHALGLSGWNGLYGRMALLVLALLGLMVWLSLLLTQRMAGPIYRIMRRLELMAGGDLDASMQLRRRDDFQELAQQLNVTIESLRQEREQACRRAQELAGELQRLSAALDDAGDEERLQALVHAQNICSQLTGQMQSCKTGQASSKQPREWENREASSS